MKRPLGSCAIICVAILVPGTFLLVARADAGILYGSTASGASGVLYTTNLATGAVIHNVGPLNDASSLNYGMTGLAFHPVTGILYGSTHNFTGANPATLARLVTINPNTAQVTVVGAFNLPAVGNPARAPTMTDLAFDSAGSLYGVGSIGAQLYSINTGTGQATQIGNAGFTFTEGGGLAVSPAGVFYGTPTQNSFGTYNSTLGTFTNITNPAKPAGLSYSALAFDGGTLYGINNGPSATRRLVTIVPATGAVTDLGAAINAIDAITFRPFAAADFNGDGAVGGGDLSAWTANYGLTPGAAKSQGDADADGDVDGRDFLIWQRQVNAGGAAAVPEPAPLAIAAACVVSALKPARQRRRAAS